ncbi:MAG: 16S rRNA (cytosine(1402)-N(4))-methyltransferase RsmH [Calditrichaeota bacterium]|nr:16S rRNA (cytosine(1402)-N(4))-methyltransferase RsmH [Calditrichota bacterium]MCB0269330.1 16S rRNA (cytosine(1402)-N(4))-methyltransferase RsmH [Calditrichota bacterium]
MGYGFHEPVLGREVVEYLVIDRRGKYVDCTLGGGGHSQLILEFLENDGFLIGLDADTEAIQYASQRLQRFPNTHFRQTFYDQIDVALYEADKYPVQGILFDLGVSSWQIDVDERGFSYQNDGPLDMRMDQRQSQNAADVLNNYTQDQLEHIFREFGEERHWRAIAREVVRTRSSQSLKNTKELVKIVRSVIGERHLNKSLARIFQAIRIEVNRELERLEAALESSFQMLDKGGRLAVISYHSLEDRIVKNFFKEKERDCICPPEFPTCVCDKVSEMRLVTRKPVTASAEEVKNNQRARSAKLRIAEKTIAFKG